MSPDDLPIFEEAPDRSLEVPARAIRPRRAWPAAAMVAAIAVCIVLAGFMNRPSRQEEAKAVPVPWSPSSTAAVVDPRGRTSFASGPAQSRPVQVVDLASPGLGTIAMTSDRLTVAGHVLVRASRVEIVLAANGNRLFGQASADVSDPDGGIRPAREPAFAVQFDLSGRRGRWARCRSWSLPTTRQGIRSAASVGRSRSRRSPAADEPCDGASGQRPPANAGAVSSGW